MTGWWQLTRWTSTICIVVGLALGWVWVDTFRDLDRWKDELRRTGVPAQGYVYDRTDEQGGTMYFRYQAAEFPARARQLYTYERWVPCNTLCLAPGSTSQIWYNPADPGDFVTSFDELSFERGNWQVALGVGGLLLAVYGVGRSVADLANLRRDSRPAARPNPAVPGQGRPAGKSVLLINSTNLFGAGPPVRRARSSAEALALLEKLRGEHIEELRIGPTPGDSVRPVVEWLRDEASSGTRPRIDRILVHPDSPHAINVTRVLREYGYWVSMMS
ncbi:DUF3592 domain-containing protein [Actinoplanes solisilvae]|uniref:DUF3592 domain-containing protein n=1 Tax=Actinoplanes solisilvae TaxID=2486853 RepID=UPI000FDA929E|nr:DUF3592 domain-containing protein [Actinoplanes solisilvae]